MKLFNINDARKFFERVLNCEGAVYCRDRDGKTYDMKRMAEYSIRSGMAEGMKGIDEIDLTFEKPSDVMAMLSYAKQMVMEENRLRSGRFAHRRSA